MADFRQAMAGFQVGFHAQQQMGGHLGVGERPVGATRAPASGHRPVVSKSMTAIVSIRFGSGCVRRFSGIDRRQPAARDAISPHAAESRDAVPQGGLPPGNNTVKLSFPSSFGSIDLPFIERLF